MPDVKVPRRLRLHVQCLTDGDIAKVSTFLRIGRERLRCEWEVAFGGDLHVLMLGGDEPDTVDCTLGGPLATLRVVDPGENRRSVGGVLVRPLQYDIFIEALAALERRFVPGCDAAAAPAAADVVPAAPIAIAAPTFPGAIPRGVTFRLHRWPSVSMLHRHRYHLRLASCLSLRHTGIDELARLSNVGLLVCEGFVTTLLVECLLDVKVATVTSAQGATRVGAQEALAPAAARARPDTGLFGKICCGLGLTLKR